MDSLRSSSKVSLLAETVIYDLAHYCRLYLLRGVLLSHHLD